MKQQLLMTLLAAWLGGPALANDLAKNFAAPPASAGPWVYWFWVSGNISKEGITADLEAMARVGIKGALIMNVQQGLTAPKPVVFMSPEWREMFHHCVRQADRLGLQICMHNCDGWSGSGGPWNPPEKAMQQLTWTETRFTGPGACKGVLPEPLKVLEHYRDIAVLAFPAPAGERAAESLPKPVITSSVAKLKGELLQDGNPNTEVVLPTPQPKSPVWLQFAFPTPVKTCGFTIRQGKGAHITVQAELLAADDAKSFRKLCELQLGWHQDAVNRTVTVAFPETTARCFRLVVLGASEHSAVMRFSEAALLNSARLNYWEAKAGFSYHNEHGGGPEFYTPTMGGGTTKNPPVLPASVPLVARIAQNSVLDLTRKMDASGRLTWEVPAGEWIVQRIGHTANGRVNGPATEEGRGPACDKMSAAALDTHFAGMAGKLLKEVGPLAGKAFSGIEIDSWECGIQNWTPAFREEFRQRRGYDLTPFLPVMLGGRVVENAAVSERFLADVRRTLADLIAENYYRRSSQLCRQNGLTFFSEGSGRQQFLYDPIGYQREGDLPMGEFWMGHPPRVDCKVAASVSHLYGKPVAGAEAFTSGPATARWANDPYDLKRLGDEAFCMGINRFVFHRYALQPWLDQTPGATMGPWGIHFERTITWWDQGAAWVKYLARCENLLQRGQFVADVCCFTGEAVPNYLGRREELTPSLPEGYDYDGCDANAILKLMSVDAAGRIVLTNGMRYRVLLLPNSPAMSPKLLHKLRDLVREGATLVGPKPKYSLSLQNYPACDTEVKAMADEVWGDCDGQKVKEHPFGKGRVLWGRGFKEMLPALGAPPDFAYQSASRDAKLNYIHRREGEVDIYFVATDTDQPMAADCVFRVEGKRPEFWHPDTGRLELPALFSAVPNGVRVPIQFDPRGSLFVIFRSAATTQHAVSIRPIVSPTTSPQTPQPAPGSGRQPANTFSMSLWVKPKRMIDLPLEAATGMVPLRHNFAIYAAPGHEVFGENEACAGVSVGQNGVCVVEHGARHMVPVLVYPGKLDDWTHVAVVYRNGQPELYLNGKLVHTGLKSSKTVHASVTAKHKRKITAFAGETASVMEFDRALTPADMAVLASAQPQARPPRPPQLIVNQAGELEAWFEEPGTFEVQLGNGRAKTVSLTSAPPVAELSGAWTVRFQPQRGAPEMAVFDKLISWPQHPDVGIKYFSGTASYVKEVEAPRELFAPGRLVWLDLGGVKNLAEVIVNGQNLGVLWKPPFKLEVTGKLKPGKNHLEIRVTNLWPNRLIGDEQLPEDAQYARHHLGGGALKEWPDWFLNHKSRASGRVTFSMWKHWGKDDALLPSGLLGPVTLRATETTLVK